MITKIWGFGLNNGQNGPSLVHVLNGFIAFTFSTEKDEKAFASLLFSNWMITEVVVSILFPILAKSHKTESNSDIYVNICQAAYSIFSQPYQRVYTEIIIQCIKYTFEIHESGED